LGGEARTGESSFKKKLSALKKGKRVRVPTLSRTPDQAALRKKNVGGKESEGEDTEDGRRTVDTRTKCGKKMKK